MQRQYKPTWCCYHTHFATSKQKLTINNPLHRGVSVIPCSSIWSYHVNKITIVSRGYRIMMAVFRFTNVDTLQINTRLNSHELEFLHLPFAHYVILLTPDRFLMFCSTLMYCEFLVSIFRLSASYASLQRVHHDLGRILFLCSSYDL